MPTRRQRRVSELIHRELSLLLMREARDPRLAGVTVTEVRVTPDLLVARVYYSVLGDAEQEKEAAIALESAKGYLRTQLAAQVRLRLAPDLVFHFDESTKYGRHIDELLAQVAEDLEPKDESEPA
jgi:ribosome-binding factor A